MGFMSGNKKAKFVPDKGGELKTVRVLYNPSSLSFSILPNYRKQRHVLNADKEGKENISMKYSKNHPRTMNMVLHFDTYESHYEGLMSILPANTMRSSESVYKEYIACLQKFVQPEKDTCAPPEVTFIWGAIKFHGVIKDFSYKYTMFTSKGVPVRAEVSLSMLETPK